MQAHQSSFSSELHAEKLGHRRRPSIGKSMPVTSLLLNFPPPSQSKNYSSLSRDGLSPDMEKPPIFFQLNDVNEMTKSSLDENSDDTSSCEQNYQVLVSECSDLDNKESEKCLLICGSSNYVSCPTCITTKPTVKDETVLTELCNKLCNINCKKEGATEDLEDIGRETNDNNMKENSFLKVPSKIDQKRKEFLNDLLNNNGDPNDINPEQFNIKDFREKFAIAEALAKTSMMTSPAAKRRLAARKIEMEFDGDYGGATSDDEKEYIPPRQLLLYLVRMGSFNSAPKINNTDSQDDNLEVPEGLNTNDLVQHCKIMRGENRPQLLTRYFLKPTNDSAIISNDITDGLRVLKLNAVSKVCSAPISSPNQLRIFQWNILSQSLGQNNDGFVQCPEEALTWDNRKYLIVEEILQNNPDVVCLQEVDHFKFLERVLGSQNYNGIFFPKPDSPCLYIQENNGPDGCAIFYKRDKFELVNFETRVLEVWRVQSNQVAIAANLRIRDTGKEICVCTTHLKARSGALLSKLRNEQGKDLLRFINATAQGRPLILSGDFNAEPSEPVYSTVLNYKTLGLSSAYADLNGIDKVLSKTDNDDDNVDGSKVKQNGVIVGTENENVKTLAEMSANLEPPYTTWKIREDGEVCHTIDYVFYTKNNLKINNCLLFPQENEIGKSRTPSFQYPSDHFSLVCDLELLED